METHEFEFEFEQGGGQSLAGRFVCFVQPFGLGLSRFCFVPSRLLT